MNTTQPTTDAAITRVLTGRDLIDAADPELHITCRRIVDLVHAGADRLDTVERLVVGRDPWALGVAQNVIDAVKEVRR